MSNKTFFLIQFCVFCQNPSNSNRHCMWGKMKSQTWQNGQEGLQWFRRFHQILSPQNKCKLDKTVKTITRGLWKLTGRKQVNNHFEKFCWILGWNLWHSCQELKVLTSQLLYTPQLCWGNSATTVRPTMKARSPNSALSQVHTWCAVIKTANLGGHKWESSQLLAWSRDSCEVYSRPMD